jgi:hypothetical protein
LGCPGDELASAGEFLGARGAVGRARLTTSTFDALKMDPAIGRAEALRRAMLAMIENASDPWNAYPDLGRHSP